MVFDAGIFYNIGILLVSLHKYFAQNNFYDSLVSQICRIKYYRFSIYIYLTEEFVKLFVKTS